jgi:protein gp37
MGKSKIEWTETTWNPTTGCTKMSAGCTNCYAEEMSLRLKSMGVDKYKNGFKLSVHPQELDMPYTWKREQMVFVNSMSDLFHESMPLDFIKAVFKVMNENPQHIFQVLTKRAEILSQYNCILDWTENIWMGVSIEDYTQIKRIEDLKSSNASIKFLSLEPLLTKLPELNLNGIDWVIVGGESGPKSRPIEKDWVLSIKDNCEKYNVPFFFKQWGGKNKKKAGRILDGRTYNEMPTFNRMKDLII